ncbi:hypothetical protein PHLCEN_2v11615 [Hermanssonia centrifuga]|uniref:SH3 domain-containing protein n=1 Tax=Hermanssonia centrifuga TaxID=98765 RepID=A0A2R6NJE9_9APHY|nr:hypothetical protein PHLCEN_2v11615 [Hermanssonia centrifuga]
MASAVAQETQQEVPRLTLSVDQSASTSPFPSPGSPFLPPPKLGAHEFASKLSPVDHIMRTAHTKRRSKEGDNGEATTDGQATPTITTPNSPPVTPTPHTFRLQQQITPVTIPDLTQSSSLTTPDKLFQRESLTSSRPAPPSPALSRRTSAALSRRSTASTRSRAHSRVTSFSQQQPEESAHRTEASSSTVSPTKRRSLLIKIRDFAFPQSDNRHFGRGSDVPRANRPRRRESTSSTSSSSADGEQEVEEEQWHDTRTIFQLNTLSSHFWGGKSGESEESAAGPSRTDFDRNFEASPTDENSQEDYDDTEEDDYVPPGEDGPLVSGTYRALYSFDPEGTAEMALEEEQVVHVIGRGGGVGWAIVEKEDGGHALVPESYLELVQADDTDGQE